MAEGEGVATATFTMPRLLAAGRVAETAAHCDHAPRLALSDAGAREERSNGVVHDLLDRGLGRGDLVGLTFSCAGWIEFAIACCAVQEAGSVAETGP